MKRQYFDISLGGSVIATTFAWNSSIRAIEKHVQQQARDKGTIYFLVDSKSKKAPNDKYCMLSGHRTWRSDTETLHYTITLRSSTTLGDVTR